MSRRQHHDAANNGTEDNTTQCSSSTVTNTAGHNRSSSSTGFFVDLDGEEEIKVELRSPLLNDDNNDGDSDGDKFEIENTEDFSPSIINAKTLEQGGLVTVLENMDKKQSWNRVVSTVWPDEGRRGRHYRDEEHSRTSINAQLSARSIDETPLMDSFLSTSLDDIEDDQHYHRRYPSINMSLVGEEQRRKFAISAVFLADYENSRPCSLSSKIDSITSVQLVAHKFRFSILWQLCVYAAMCYLFISSYFEGHDKGTPTSPMALLVLTVIVDTIFALDMITKRIYSGYDHDSGADTDTSADEILPDQHNPNVRKARNRWWNIPMVLLLLALSCETIIKFWVNQLHPNDGGFELCIWSGIFKPIVFFYVSSKAQDAISALSQVTSIVSRVIFIELFIILSFAAVACHLYSSFSAFADLPHSFRSLFELSTTAVTPSLWIPVYNEQRSAVLFFVPFIIICVFYMHSLVLSVVFQTYIQAMSTIRDRASADRDEALKLAFLALQPVNQSEGLSEMVNVVQVAHIRSVLRKIRPHYSSTKIDALIQIVDSSSVGTLDFSTFRSHVPKALRTSLRSNRQGMQDSLMLKSLATFVAIINLCYVLILSSALQSIWWEIVVLPAGTIIVSLCVFEVTLRLCLCYCSCMPTTIMHRFLDVLAALAGLISIYGLFHYPIDHHRGLEYLLLGRAIDLIRIMRLSELFCAILSRTGQVLPALVGPLALVFSSLHIFTYIGMLLWGGAITVGKQAEFITPLYDLNNFNDYLSGLLTMFNIFVVNDWNAIANVYLHADRCSSPYIVYFFFISANLVGVSIMMNVLTAFFVGAFVTQVESKRDGETSDGTPKIRVRMTNENTTLSTRDTPRIERVNSYGGTRSEFRVYQRQGYDDVIQAVTGDNDAISVAKKAHDILEIFERLSPAIDQQVAYLICRQQSQDYFGNKNFLSISKIYIIDIEIHGVIADMLSELIESPSAGPADKNRSSCCLQRVFLPLVKCSDERQLVISASLINQNPHVGLFVARIM